jgi:hypothetical protein
MLLAESVAAEGRRAGRPPGPLTSAELARLVADAVTPDGELARRKVFGRAEVIVAVAPLLFGRPMSELARAVDAVLADREVILLVGVAAARNPSYTLAHVVVTEQAIANTVAIGTAVGGAGVLPDPLIERAVARVEQRLGQPLTDGQVSAVRGICTGARQVSLVLGVAGSGKTTALAAVAGAYRTAGYQLIGTATAGQAARTLGREADIPARTLASLCWRLQHSQLELTDRTLVVLDEAGMTDDPDLLYVLSAASIAQAKVVLVGDDCQLGPVGPGGALGALLERHRGLVHVLDENVRQLDPGERQALAELRAGDIATAVDWYAKHDRIRVSADRDDAIAATVEGWAADSAQGRDAVMVAWRRSSVHDLNHHGRHAWLALGQLSGPELVAPGGRRYQAGDRVVTLAAAPDSGLVTSQHGTVTMVNPQSGALIARMDDGHLHRLEGDQLAANRLDYSYALTVHRSQGSTVQVCHDLADGGGRELAYVAMSRARSTTIVHTVADDLDQAVEDLTQKWGQARRPVWAIDQGRPDPDAETRPSQSVRLVSEDTAGQLGQLIERARLRAERDALAVAIPHDPSADVDRNQDQQRREQTRLAGLRQGDYYGDDPQLAEACRRLVHATDQRDSVAYRRSWPGHGRRELRRLNREVDRWTNAMSLAQADWQRLSRPEIEKVTTALEQLQHEEQQLRQQHANVVAWCDQHPEARGRLAMLDHRLHQLDNPKIAVSNRPAAQQHRKRARFLSQSVEHAPQGRDLGHGLSM